MVVGWVDRARLMVDAARRGWWPRQASPDSAAGSTPAPVPSKAKYREPIIFRALKPRDFYPPPERGHSTVPGVVTLLPRN